jgi:hypothetical protein
VYTTIPFHFVIKFSALIKVVALEKLDFTGFPQPFDAKMRQVFYMNKSGVFQPFTIYHADILPFYL